MFIIPKHTARDLLHSELRILINEIFLIQNSKYINRNLRRISPYLNLLLQDQNSCFLSSVFYDISKIRRSILADFFQGQAPSPSLPSFIYLVFPTQSDHYQEVLSKYPFLKALS